MKPPFAYYGGKMGLSAEIVRLLPPHRVYIEPFFGSGAVFFAKGPASHEIINDLDDRVVTFFRVLRDQPEELERVCRLTPYARAEYYAARAAEPTDDLERARLFWVTVNQGFGKVADSRTGWSVTVARNSSNPQTVRSRLGRFQACAERLAGASIERCDAVDLIERLAKTEDTVLYVDPPYVTSTRVGRKHRASDYSHEMTDDDHRELARALHETPATVVLSGYPSKLYDELYDGWWYQDFEVTAFSSNAARCDRSGRIERIWMNRPPVVTLFDGREEAA